MQTSQLYPGIRLIEPNEDVDFGASISGTYETKKKDSDWKLELKIDSDKPRPYSKSLGFVSGTLTKKKSSSIWSGNASAGYFKSHGKGNVKAEAGCIEADIFVKLSDGGRCDGTLKAVVKQSRGRVVCDATIKIESKTITLEGLERTSQFFRDVTIDIDYVDKVEWPVISLNDYDGTSAALKSRKLDLFSVFEDAGIKLHYDSENSQKVEDPTPDTRWNKTDMYAVMEDYFNGGETDESIWCLMATNPPDSRYMGYSFNKDETSGFGLFVGHTSFNGLESDDVNVKVKATRRFLHYMTHECGHCLGLAHPFEEGKPDSLSWMNYAWKYDSSYGAGTFYDRFQYAFSDDELIVLRHQPDKTFKSTYAQESGTKFQFSPGPKSSPPDFSNDESDDEDEESMGDKPKSGKSSSRKFTFTIKIRSKPFTTGDIVEFEGILRNMGRLPCKIEPDLSPGGGNLTVYVTDPLGNVQVAKPFVTGIDAPTRRYITLGKADSRENSDVYSEMIPLIQSAAGAMFQSTGTYQIKAVYEGSGAKATSKSVSVVIENDEEDNEEKNQVRLSTSTDGSLSDVQGSLLDYWRKLVSKPIQEKMKRIQIIVCLLCGLSSAGVKIVTNKRSSSRKRRKSRKIERTTPPRSSKELLEDVADLVQYFKDDYDGDMVDNHNYAKFILTRGKMLLGIGEIKQAEMEYNQLVADLLARDADFDFVKRIANDWEKMRHPDHQPSSTEVTESFQKRVEKLLAWVPIDVSAGEKEQSGIDLGRPFNNFDDEHLSKAFRFADDLKKIEDNTDDLDAVLDYAEGIMKAQEVNTDVYKWALETFIVHSKLVKRHGVRYPDPPKRDRTMTSMAAIIETKREGKPMESWMNYWRCDGDFNYHHRHWHAVYRGARYFDMSNDRRQGELFGYMHSQMLARYDADRESWGLSPVVPYEIDEVEPDGFDAGWEFHEDPAHSYFAPRPPKQTWTRRLKFDVQGQEKAIVGCFDIGKLPKRGPNEYLMDSNLAGHIIEATSGTWRYEFGSFHNNGHMAFCSTKDIPQEKTTYMGSSLTAVRDPIFFRWHKRVDNVFQNWNNRVIQEVGDDAPGVIINPEDALITPGNIAPAGFDEWNKTGWKQNKFKNGQIKTFLKPPELAFEWDNKLDHESFTYHIRMMRKPGVEGDLALTVRIFICQERHVDKRRRWIEMDKFVHVMNANENHLVLKRSDKESSVIKRLPKDVLESQEKKFVSTVDGNCECGWPYKMLLPRGVNGGEKWLLGVFVSDNTKDGIGVRSSCGSMSYCGTRDSFYPDKRTMGYPFSTQICISDKQVTITQAAKTLSNFCISQFEIDNDFKLKTPEPKIPEIVWFPSSSQEEKEDYDSPYIKSMVTGRFRVLLDDLDFRKMSAERVRIRFAGRGDIVYTVKDIKIALRRGNTLDVDHRCNVSVKFKGLNTVEIPPEGATSDELILPVKTAPENDYFVTFTLTSPGCFLNTAQVKQVNSYWVTSTNASQATAEDDWEKIKGVIKKQFRWVYCVQSLEQ